MAKIDPIKLDDASSLKAPRLMSADVFTLPLPSLSTAPAEFKQPAAAQPAAPDVVAALQQHSQSILASITAFQESERQRSETAIQTIQDEAEQRLAEMSFAIEQARQAASIAESNAVSARADADDVLEQLSLALGQVRSHAALVETLRQDLDALSISASTARKEADWVKAQWTGERDNAALAESLRQELDALAVTASAARAETDWAKDQWASERARAEGLENRVVQAERRTADAEMTALGLRSEIDTLRAMLTERGVRPMMSGSINLDMAAHGTTIYPVQVTAVIDCKPTPDQGLQPVESGIGVIFDVRLVAAIPQDASEDGHGIENAVGLARTLFPTAPLSMVVSEDCDLSAFRSHHTDVTFIGAPADDSRRKAARVLANAAGHLHRG